MKRFLSIGAVSALVLGGAALVAPPAHAAQPSYSVMLLEPVSGKQHTTALGLNDAGDVVGTSQPARLEIDGGGQSTLWPARNPHGVVVAPEFRNSTAADISNSGVIVGNYFNATPPSSYWYESGAAEQIVLMGVEVHVEAISANGVATLNGHTSAPQGFEVTGPTSASPLGLLPGATASWVTGISADGHRIAGTTNLPSQRVATIWTDGVPTALTAPEGSSSVLLDDVNDSGVAVGCATIDVTAVALRFEAGAGTALPAPQGSTGACATAVNNTGVIGGHARIDGLDSAVLWRDGAVLNLNDIAAGRTGYTLLSVLDMNASGQLVGQARLSDGTLRGYVATPSTGVSVYTTPGYHELNGREWRTMCEPYSQTTRCRTEIVATQVRYSDGTYTRVTDWAFNNLTYTPSPRSLWAGNPLGNEGEWTATDGRQWRTECDTPATGGNGCRSYVLARVATATPNPEGGYTYTVADEWVFNNIVRFS